MIDKMNVRRAVFAVLITGSISAAHAQSRLDQVPTGSVLLYRPENTAQVVSAAPQTTSGVQIVRNTGGIGSGTVTHPEYSPANPGTLSNGNIAGLLAYCVRSGTLDDTTTRHIARVLATRQDVREDQNYSLGGQGLIRNQSPNPIDLATMTVSQRTATCSTLTSRGHAIIE